MKFFLFILFSAVTLTLFGIISHSEKSAQEAKRYREQRKLELSSSKHDNSDFWPSSTANMVVTYPKKKPVLVANTNPPPPKPIPEYKVYPTERKITAKDYRKDYVVSPTMWVNGVEVPNDGKLAKEIQNEIRTLFTL